MGQKKKQRARTVSIRRGCARYTLFTLIRCRDVNSGMFLCRCLAFTSQKCTGVWMDAASVGQSPRALVSQTASGMRRTSGAVLGRKRNTRSLEPDLFLGPFLTDSNCLAGWVKRDLEKSVMPACSWWNAGKNFLWEPRRTGTMWVWIWVTILDS